MKKEMTNEERTYEQKVRKKERQKQGKKCSKER